MSNSNTTTTNNNNNNNKAYVFCNNCGKTGHAFHQCKHPITSNGVIAFRVGENGKEYLMIRRKDTLGFVDFMRGKYQLHNKLYLMNIIDEMTLEEKQSLLEKDFEELWCKLWGINVGMQYRAEERASREKMETLKYGVVSGGVKFSLASLIADSKTRWTEPEWGYPKGRRNYKENDMSCALREFEEETGYSKKDLRLVNNIIPFEEVFTGSNYKSYKHRYYIGEIDAHVKPQAPFQTSEVSLLEWKTYDEVINALRPYNLEKKDVIWRVKELLDKYTLYQ
jgi:8-oxo-dGTP pyrophosphatase MutT (NUDIX family)